MGLLAIAGRRRFGSSFTPPGLTLFNPDYPRRGSYSLGGTQNASNSALADVHVNVVPYYPTWEGSRGPLQTKIAAVKSATTIGALVLPYVIMVDALDAWGTPPQANYEWYKKLVDNPDWFVWLNSVTHTTKVVGSATGWSKPNYTEACPVISGKTAAQWKRDWDFKLCQTGGVFFDGTSNHTVTPCSNIDGIYDDNVFARERSAGDYNFDGTSETTSDSTLITRVQQAHATNLSYWLGLNPSGRLMMANCADWPIWYPTGTGVAGLPIDQIYDGGVLENIDEWLNGTRSSAASDLMRSIKVCQDAFKGSKLGILELQTTATAWATLRQWHVISCLTGTYFYPHLTSGYLAQELGTVVYDERNVLLGQPVSGSAGNIQWTPTYQAGSSGTGIYRRDFDNGIVLWAAPGKTYTSQALGGTFTKINGANDPTYNNGGSISSWAPTAGDSLVLLR
jgi:hypothetical protein